MPDQHLDITTRAVTGGRPAAVPDAPLNTPVTLASTYIAGGDAEYGRYANPSWTAFEDVLGDLESGRCLAFASGMAAIAAVLDLVPARGRVVAPRHSYTGTMGQLRDSAERGRITVDFVDITDTDAVIAAAAGAACIWIESPTNPALEVADLPAIAAAGRRAGALVVVDNTFATPLVQRPLELGADVVVHAATKAIAGHSDVLMGATVVADDDRYDALLGIRSLRGAIPAPLEAFLALRGLRTLPVRFERAQASAEVLVERLGGHPAIEEVRYPGFGGIVSIVLADAATADRFIGALRLWRHATSLGGVESTLERRRRWPAEAPTIPEGLVRLSVGLEHPDDLWADLEAALGGR
ncbi:PLP-dependent aspartate aminotransferase family protein [Amnibacterium sp.]|uniref:trans-sulfuration enzyme family protein n=1 Tax=Amnibacterium sp. TaxID=1872496 RepID=UPI0026308857|nr:PLP-dependent aspartate aminotransferase family protein [Amnibacterium sp.]MCU1472271.1 cystathionine gamma-synthase [Amnibacterium sp.]